jgi:hypothetical protein
MTRFRMNGPIPEATDNVLLREVGTTMTTIVVVVHRRVAGVREDIESVPLVVVRLPWTTTTHETDTDGEVPPGAIMDHHDDMKTPTIPVLPLLPAEDIMIRMRVARILMLDLEVLPAVAAVAAMATVVAAAAMVVMTTEDTRMASPTNTLGEAFAYGQNVHDIVLVLGTMKTSLEVYLAPV